MRMGCSVREAGGRQELGRSEAVRAGRRRKPWSAVRRGEKEAVSSGCACALGSLLPEHSFYGTQAFSSWSVMEPPLSP